MYVWERNEIQVNTAGRKMQAALLLYVYTTFFFLHEYDDGICKRKSVENTSERVRDGTTGRPAIKV